MDLQLGKSVISSDGVYLGTVARLVLDPDMKGFREFIVHHRILFPTERLVEAPFIAEVDEDGTVHLNVTAEQARQLPRFVEHEYYSPTGEEFRTGPYPAGTAFGPAVLMRSSYSGSNYQAAMRGLGEPGPIDASSVEVRTNLPDDAVMVDARTGVVTDDGRRVGTVDEIVYDQDGEIQEIVVRAGFFAQQPLRVARKDIASFAHDEVRLSIPLSALEASATAAEPVDTD
ncbi:MAG TPA: PRC-barrel domain-containing protein [Thermomicrobiaceae bacterium]|nr:PRC-barrel domain-containing protein [Thermomicrobiaceae bacterium]